MPTPPRLRKTGLILPLLASMAPPGAGQTPIYSIHGSRPGMVFGFTHSGVGDVNQDGFDDFVVGAPRDDSRGTASGSASLCSGRDGTVLLTVYGDRPDDLFGYASSGAGDLNRDGVPDFAVSAPREPGLPGRGYVRVVSGADGSPLRTLWSDGDHELYGLALQPAGDVNLDGYTDLMVGAPQTGGLSQRPGYVRLFSGADGTVLRELNGSAVGDAFGFSVNGAGDVDRDGVPDLLVGAPLAQQNGRAFLFSGRNGGVIHGFSGRSVLEFFGSAVCPAGDVDGDGVPDVAIGASRDGTNGQSAGAVRVFSGADGAQRRVFFGDGPCDLFGITMQDAGDLNGDGEIDLIVGTHKCGHTGYARAFSGADGTPLFTLTGRLLDHFGLNVGAAGDVNADGHADLIVSAHTDYENGHWSGTAHVFSGRRLALSADDHRLSLSDGGAIGFTLDAGPASANSVYLLVGSVSGIAPGINLGAVTLPLNWDFYLAHTLDNPNTFPLLNSLGTLDGSAQANATFALPAGSPPVLAGLRLDHAYVVYASGSFTLASNPVPMTLVN